MYFSYDFERAKKLNVEDKIATLEKTLNSWKRRKLTLTGKIHIVKTSGLSKRIYSASVLAMSKHTVKRILKNHFHLPLGWQTCQNKEKKTIIAEKKHGGLKMIDFEIMERSLKIAWIKRIVENNHTAGKIIPEHVEPIRWNCVFHPVPF